MADPFTIIGTAASLVQLVQAVAKGLLNLRNAVKSIKDVHDKIQALSNQIQQITHPILSIQSYIKNRPADIGYELFVVIDDVTQSCHACLKKFQSHLPAPPKSGRSHQKIDAAIRIWINNHDLEETRRHIGGYVQNLGLIMAVLNLCVACLETPKPLHVQVLIAFRFKVDQVDAKLDAIAHFLKETVQYRSVSNQSIASSADPEALEINVKIRAVANHLATSIAMKEPNIAPRRVKPQKTSISSATTEGNEDSQTLLPELRPEREQLNHELEANRSALTHLRDYQLYEGAVEIQRRAIEIKEFLAPDPELWPTSIEYHEMQEVLADILLQCDSEEYRQEALTILQLEACHITREMPSTVPIQDTSTHALQKLINLHLKMGKAYKETGQSDFAMRHLREAFKECNKLEPKDSQTLQIIGENLLEVYEYQVQDCDESQRVVRITQLQGFRKEFEVALGRPFTECNEAVRWFDNANIAIPKVNERYRFDIVDQESSTSPLHIAAERCNDTTVLQQIIENSNTLENLNGENETPLLVAVENANINAVALLMKNNASVKARDKEQQTVLHKSQRPPVIKILLQSRTRRTSSASECSRSTSETHFRRVSSSSSSAATTTTNTTYSNLAPSEEAILSDLDINSQDVHQKTPLWIACLAGRAKTVDLLLAARADPNKARHGTTPLVAVINSTANPYLKDPGKRVRIVEALVRAGADPAPGREALQHRSKGTDYKRLLRALDTSCDRSLLSPTSTGYLTLPEVDRSTTLIDFPKFGC